MRDYTIPEGRREPDGPDELQMVYAELQSAQNKNALDAARIVELEAALAQALEILTELNEALS